MNEQSLLQLDSPRRTMVVRLAAFFEARPNWWIDGRELATVAGYAAWRTRVSDLRHPPFNLTIRNRQRYVRRTVLGGGERFTISEYMLVPAVKERRAS